MNSDGPKLAFLRREVAILTGMDVDGLSDEQLVPLIREWLRSQSKRLLAIEESLMNLECISDEPKVGPRHDDSSSSSSSTSSLSATVASTGIRVRPKGCIHDLVRLNVFALTETQRQKLKMGDYTVWDPKRVKMEVCDGICPLVLLVMYTHLPPVQQKFLTTHPIEALVRAFFSLGEEDRGKVASGELQDPRMLDLWHRRPELMGKWAGLSPEHKSLLYCDYRDHLMEEFCALDQKGREQVVWATNGGSVVLWTISRTSGLLAILASLSFEGRREFSMIRTSDKPAFLDDIRQRRLASQGFNVGSSSSSRNSPP